MNETRSLIFQDEAEVVVHEKHPAKQHIIRFKSQSIANSAQPGSFVHIRCGEKYSLRRPVSIMQTNKQNGSFDILFKVVGAGTNSLAKVKAGDSLNILGPIGKPFTFSKEQPRGMLIGGGVGVPPMIFMAKTLKEQGLEPMVILGSEVKFPFSPVISKLKATNIPDSVNTTMPLLEELGIPARCASQQAYPGTYKGYVTDLAKLWLEGLDESERAQVMVYACGPLPMLKAVHKLAKEFDLPCQVSLEEYMACGIGGCAGCVVRVQEGNVAAMRRVCVDGPVFDSYQVF